MRAWLDFLPLVVFFAAYKMHGIMTAAMALMIAVMLIYGGLWWRERRLETGQWITVIATVLLGSLTLLLHDERYLQWKAPGVYVLLALIFAGSRWIGERPLAERMMGQAVTLSAAQWQGLNWAWVVFFLASAAANAWVVLFLPAWWVDFKLFGSLAMTFAFVLAQGVWFVRIGALRADTGNGSGNDSGHDPRNDS